MTGARAFAWSHVKPWMVAGCCVIDIGCGDPGNQWIRREVEPLGEYLGVDKHTGFDGGDEAAWRAIPKRPWSLAVSCWALCCWKEDEGFALTMIRRHVALPTTPLLIIGRHYPRSTYEDKRADPLNGYSEEGWRSLAMATGWEVVSWIPGWYELDRWGHDPRPKMNCFASLLRVRP